MICSLRSLCVLILLGFVIFSSTFVAAGEVSEGTETFPTPPSAAPSEEEKDWQGKVNEFFGTYLLEPFQAVLFYDFGTKKSLGASVPLLVLWLLIGALFFTLRMGFINVRGFRLALQMVRGDYDDPKNPGEVTHFQALSAALSATIGLGNIAGVAIAIGMGGPGAVFWMIVAGFLGMTSKFAECSLGQMYRNVSPDGTVSGGPMHYLRDGLRELGWGKLGAIMAVFFAIMCMGGSFGMGCMFQVAQSMQAVSSKVAFLDRYCWVYGLVMAFLVGFVIIGGIRRIAATASKIVPFMCLLYCCICIYIILNHVESVGWAFGRIFQEAFTSTAVQGGILGVMVIGIRRAAFSNEAGVGSAAIAHSAAKVQYPVSEGVVAMLGPFIDTVVICTMTALVIILTGVTQEFPDLVAKDHGAELTARAFGSVHGWFPWILCVSVVLFAYSTMISWSYYGERCWSNLFGRRSALVYKILFLTFVFLGSVVTATKIIEFSDLMILSMAFPNMFGVMLLSGKIRRELDAYWKMYKTGQLKKTR